MEARCYLKTMGYPELRTLDGTLVRLKVRKHLALLVYFAVEGRTYHRREKLVDLLWSGVPIANGRHSSGRSCAERVRSRSSAARATDLRSRTRAGLWSAARWS